MKLILLIILLAMPIFAETLPIMIEGDSFVKIEGDSFVKTEENSFVKIEEDNEISDGYITYDSPTPPIKIGVCVAIYSNNATPEIDIQNANKFLHNIKGGVDPNIFLTLISKKRGLEKFKKAVHSRDRYTIRTETKKLFNGVKDCNVYYIIVDSYEKVNSSTGKKYSPAGFTFNYGDPYLLLASMDINGNPLKDNGRRGGRSLAHELGHTLGLPHTFRDPSGRTCTTFPDTDDPTCRVQNYKADPDKAYTTTNLKDANQCLTMEPETCSSGPTPTIEALHNLMSYHGCGDHPNKILYQQCQVDKMISTAKKRGRHCTDCKRMIELPDPEEKVPTKPTQGCNSSLSSSTNGTVFFIFIFFAILLSKRKKYLSK